MLPVQCHTSVLNRNNPANYKPILTNWEVEGKRGCVWIRFGVHYSIGDLDAVKHFRSPNHRLFNCKVFRVRNAAEHGLCAGQWRIIRFK